jgi:hypothetical protein
MQLKFLKQRGFGNERLLINKPSSGCVLKREYYQKGGFENSESGGPRKEERQMRKKEVYIELLLAISIFFGIILPIVFGIRDVQLVVITFSSMWLIFTAVYFVSTFLKGRRNLKKRLKEGINAKWGYS